MNSDRLVATSPRRALELSVPRSLAAVLTLILVATANIAAAKPPDAVPVTVGGEPEYDACPTIGRVSGLNRNGDNFLSVRTGPGIDYERIDRLTTDQQLWICGTEGNWYAVVYTRKGANCGVSTPIEHAQPYAGPCLSGWVERDYVTPIAG